MPRRSRVCRVLGARVWRLADVARAVGVDVSGMSAQEAADAAIDAVRKLPADVEIPHTCNGLVAEDLEQLATDAMADACFPGNPWKSITIRQSNYSVNYGTLILI